MQFSVCRLDDYPNFYANTLCEKSFYSMMPEIGKL